MLDDDPHGLAKTLERMHEEAAETQQRCSEVAGSFNGKKTAILEQARETKGEAAAMMEIYLGEDADALDGFQFLTMAEAGEAGHWSIVKKFTARADNPDVKKLVEPALVGPSRGSHGSHRNDSGPANLTPARRRRRALFVRDRSRCSRRRSRSQCRRSPAPVATRS